MEDLKIINEKTTLGEDKKEEKKEEELQILTERVAINYNEK
jgi:hypothetical protein